MKSFLIGSIGSIIGLIGWYCFGSVACLILGVIAYIIETILEEENLNSHAKVDIYIAFGIGVVISRIRRVNPWYIGGMLGINIWSAVIIVLGLGYLISFFGKH